MGNPILPNPMNPIDVMPSAPCAADERRPTCTAWTDALADRPSPVYNGAKGGPTDPPHRWCGRHVLQSRPDDAPAGLGTARHGHAPRCRLPDGGSVGHRGLSRLRLEADPRHGSLPPAGGPDRVAHLPEPGT